MPYTYSELKPDVFTEQGQRMFLAIRDHTHRLLKQAGAARCHEMISVVTGDCWIMLACVDRMVELGEIRELTDDKVAGQHRVFVALNHD